MHTLEIFSGQPLKINFFPANKYEEIAQNLKMILSTPLASAPLARDFGLDMSFLSAPTLLGMMKLRINIIEAVRRFEPRVEVISIHFEENTSEPLDGHMKIRLKVVVLDE